MEGIFNFLERLRAKPEPTRRRILASVIIILMALIVVGWFKTLRFGSLAETNSETFQASALPSSGPSALSSPPPWEVIKTTFTEGWRDLKETLQKDLSSKDTKPIVFPETPPENPPEENNNPDE